MDPAEKIRNAVDRVARLRIVRTGHASLLSGLSAVRQLQAMRFRGTYADLLGQGPYRRATRFFLEELYGQRDYTQRDAQFSRIAGTLQRAFPAQLVGTAVALAELHAMTEELDHAMAVAWAAQGTGPSGEVERYIAAWQAVGQQERRHTQLDAVVSLGRELQRVTELPGLRFMLRMMRAPAAAAGMSELQTFLEAGFDTFAGMARAPGGASAFLGTLEQRERALIVQLFAQSDVACETALARTLGQAR